MTKNELLKMITEGATVTAEMAEKAAEMLATDAAAKMKRKEKETEKDKVKREATEALVRQVVAEVLTTEPKTATDIAAAINANPELAGQLDKPATPQKATSLMKVARELGLANQIDVKIPKKGAQKGYTAVETEVEAEVETEAE